MTSPLEREILTHYWSSPAEFPRMTISNNETMDRFVELGLLKALNEPNEYGAVYEANHDALRPYMEALASIPLPVCLWIVPMDEPK